MAELPQRLGMIAELLRLHHQRDLAPGGSEEQARAQALRHCLQEMEKVRAQQLRRRNLASALRHVLEPGAPRGEERTRCARDPHHPMDNSRVQRQQRLLLIIRSSAYGSGAPWARAQACRPYRTA